MAFGMLFRRSRTIVCRTSSCVWIVHAQSGFFAGASE